MQNFISNSDLLCWNIVLKGNSAKSMTTDKDGNLKIRPPVTAEEHQQARFGGNAESKKMQKSLLKQKFEEFKVSDSVGDVAAAVVSPYSETEFALMGLSTEGQPIYNRFASVDHMKAVPSPLTGNYMPPSNIPDIDESQMVYGKKATNSSKIKTDDDSISHSNDFVLFDFSDSYLHLIKDYDFHEKRFAKRNAEVKGILGRRQTGKPVNPNRPKPISAGQPNLVSAGCPKPVSTGLPKPVSAGRPKPVSAGRPKPVSAGRPNPVSADKPNPVFADQPNPVSAGHPNIIFAGDGILGPQPLNFQPKSTYFHSFTHNNQQIIFPITHNSLYSLYMTGGLNGKTAVKPSAGWPWTKYGMSKTKGSKMNGGSKSKSWSYAKGPLVVSIHCCWSCDFLLVVSLFLLWLLFTSAGHVIFCWLIVILAGYLVSAGHISFMLIYDPSEVSLPDSVKGLVATIDGTAFTVTEASIRSALQLDDQNAIDTLTNAEIFTGLRTIGYATEGKFTFFKNKFSPQWKFLIHTLIHCLSPKSGSWNQFGSNIATALICLSTGRKHNFSNMIFNGPDMPLLAHMLNQREPAVVQPQPQEVSSPSTSPVVEPHPSTDLMHSPPRQSSPPLIPFVLETITSPIRDDDTGGGSFSERPPSPSLATPTHSPTIGVAEEPLTLNSLLAMFPTYVQRIATLEAELKATKILHRDAVVLFAKRIKKLDSKLKTKMRKLVLSDSEDEEDARQSQELAALLDLANAALHEPSHMSTPSRPTYSEPSTKKEISPTTLDAGLSLSQSKERDRAAKIIYKRLKKQQSSFDTALSDAAIPHVNPDSAVRVDSAYDLVSTGADSAVKVDSTDDLVSAGADSADHVVSAGADSADHVVSAGGADSTGTFISAGTSVDVGPSVHAATSSPIKDPAKGKAIATPSSPVPASSAKELANQQAAILEAERQELLEQELKQSLDAEQIYLDNLLA
nr:synaptobrevin, longin-like domain protein [Tanacetum cinerariifolium]